MLEHCCWNLLPYRHKSISEVRHWCWAIRPGSQSAFQFIPNVFNGLRSGCCAGQSSSSTPTLRNDFSMDLALCTGALSCWNRKQPSSNCCQKVGSTELSRMSLYPVALRFPFTGTKGAWTMKNSPRPLFLLRQTLQLTVCIGAGNVLLAPTKPRFVRRTARWWNVIHHSRERVSTSPESIGGNAWHYALWS